jgi:hypothetical protein
MFRYLLFQTKRWGWIALWSGLVTACALPSALTGSALEQTDEELFRTLAQIARGGSLSICDFRHVEKVLGVQIDTPVEKIDQSIRDGSWIVIESSRIRVADGATNSDLKETEYRRFRSKSASHCGFAVKFSKRRFCDWRTGKFDALMGTKLTYLGASPHRSDFPMAYEYPSADGRAARILVGSSSVDCSDGFSVTVEGNWK